MKRVEIVMMAVVVTGLALPMAFAAKHLPEERGKRLFEDAAAFGGSKSCSECHPGGKGLTQAGSKARFTIGGQTQNSLEEAINFCIVNASMGKAIPVNSDRMKEMVAYFKSLGAKAPAPERGYY